MADLRDQASEMILHQSVDACLISGQSNLVILYSLLLEGWCLHVIIKRYKASS